MLNFRDWELLLVRCELRLLPLDSIFLHALGGGANEDVVSHFARGFISFCGEISLFRFNDYER